MFGSNKRPVESFIVTKPALGTIPVTGSLVNTTTGNINLADGQLGIINASIYGTVATNSFVDATPTLAEAQAIQFVQGNANSASLVTAMATYPLYVAPYETAPALQGHKKDIKVSKQPFLVGLQDIIQIGDIDAGAGRLIAADNTTYQISVGFGGTRIEEYFSTEQAIGLRAIYTSPNFTALGLTAVQSRSTVLTNLATQINYNSYGLTGLSAKFIGNDPIVAFAMGEATGTGATAVATLAVGQVVPVFKVNGLVRSITLTSEMLTSLQAAVAATPLFTHILVADIADAAFAAGLVKGLWIMALDEATAYVDYIPQRKVFLNIATPEGFAATIKNAKLLSGREGQGQGRVLDLLYKATQGQRKYFNQHNLDPVINFPSPIDVLTNYTVYNVTYSNELNVSIDSMTTHPFRTLLCIPAESVPGTPNPLIATLDTTLNSWLTSTGNTVITTL